MNIALLLFKKQGPKFLTLGKNSTRLLSLPCYAFGTTRDSTYSNETHLLDLLNSDGDSTESRLKEEIYSKIETPKESEKSTISPKFVKSLILAKDFEDVLVIVQGQNQPIGNEVLAEVLRALSSRLQNLSFKQSKLFTNNKILQNIMSLQKRPVSSLSDAAILNYLMFMRQIENSNKDLPKLTKTELESLCNEIKKRAKGNLLPPAAGSGIFQELCLLKTDAVYLGRILHGQYKDSGLRKEFSVYSYLQILRGISELRRENGAELFDFASEICKEIEEDCLSLELRLQCALFYYVCSLKLHELQSNSGNSKVLQKLEESIYAKRMDLSEDDMINVLDGYACAPPEMKPQLLEFIKSNVLNRLQTRPNSLTLNFIVRFIASTEKQRDNNRLNHASLKMISRELFRRFKLVPHPKLSSMVDCVRTYSRYKYIPATLFKLLIEKMNELPDEELTLTAALIGASIFMETGMPCQQLVDKICKLFRHEFDERNLAGLLRTLFVLSHPLVSSNEAIEADKQIIMNKIIQKFNDEQAEVIELLGRFYCETDSPEFQKLFAMAKDTIQKDWPDLNFSQKSDYALKLFPKNLSDWDEFILKEFERLDSNRLNAFLKAYLQLNTKTRKTADLMLRVTLSAKEIRANGPLIHSALIATPPAFFSNTKGKESLDPLLRKLLTELISQPLEDQSITCPQLLKFGTNLRFEGTVRVYVCLLLLEREKEMLSDKYENIFLAEAAEFFVNVLENKADIHKLPKNGTYKKLVQFLVKIYNKIIPSNLSDKEGDSLSLNFLTKTIGITKFIHKTCIQEIDPSISGKLLEKMKQKLESTPKDEEHVDSAIQAIFTVISAKCSDYIVIPDSLYSVAIQSFATHKKDINLVSLHPQIKMLEGKFTSKQLQNIREFLLVLLKFYTEDESHPYADVLCSYVLLFEKADILGLSHHEKVIQDIERTLDDIKPSSLVNELNTLSKAKLRDSNLLKRMAEKIEMNPAAFANNCLQIAYAYVKLGFIEDWVKKMITSLISSTDPNSLAFPKTNQGLYTLWPLVALGISKDPLITKAVQLVEQGTTFSEGMAEHEALALHLMAIISRNKESNSFKFEPSFSPTFIAKIDLLRLPKRQIAHIDKALGLLNTNFEKNKLLEQGLFADIYLSDQNTIILLVSEALITVGEKEPTGLFLVKEKLFKDLHPDTKIVRLLEYEWNSLQTDEDRLQYLKKILGF